jgi:hypothetical protein
MEAAMRAVIVLMATVLSVPASAQTITMYIRPPRAVLCDRLDYAKIAVQVAIEAVRSGKAARAFPPGCWVVKPNLPVVLLDQHDDIAYVGVNAGPNQVPSRAWVHVDALSETPEKQPQRRPR